MTAICMTCLKLQFRQAGMCSKRLLSDIVGTLARLLEINLPSHGYLLFTNIPTLRS